MYSITVKCKKVVFLFFLFVLVNQNFYSQCIEIESILVDACGTIEGENEMVRFSVGNTALNTANMTVVWPNNPWQNICQNATTANAVAALNATILGCGWLVEPIGGVLPANSKVLLITSTAIDVNANSFASLSDTLIVIFQCAGNTSGHFANWSTTPGLRTLSISFSSPMGCSDAVTYDRTLLVNQNGTIGGTSAQRDGALVNFDAAGNPTYENFGCQAPFVPGNVAITAISATTICPGNVIQLFTTPSSSVTGLMWTGNNGSFNSTTNDTVTYTSSMNDTSNFYIVLEGVSVCGNVKDSILITVNPPSTAVQNAVICAGETFTLPSGLIVNTAGTYNDTIFGAAPLGCDSIITTNLTVNNLPTVTANASPASTTVCVGNAVTLSGGGAITYVWDNGITNGTPFNPTLGSVLYTVTGTDANNCSNTDTITINTINCVNLTASFVPSSFVICQGESITFTDNSIGTITNWSWNFGAGLPATANTQGPHNITFNTAGTFNINLQVTDANGNDDTTITITVNPVLTTTQNFNECQGFSITVGSNTYTTTGIFNDTLQAVSGCDSIVTTNLTINQPVAFIQNFNECQGFSITVGSNTYTTTGVFIDILQAVSGCDSVVTTNLTINQPFPVQLLENDTTLCENEVDSIILHAVGGTNLSWSNGETLIDSIIVTQSGFYTVTSNNNGCITDANIQVIFEPCIAPTVFIPNVFTPNADGMNDEFKIKGAFISTFEGTIFNRWGKEIFNWKNIEEGWDGNYQGELVPDGTYFYIVEVEFENREKKSLTGSITLLK